MEQHLDSISTNSKIFTEKAENPVFSSTMSAYFSLLRVKQWIKNLFLFIPAFFAGQIFNVSIITELLAGFLAYNLVASSIYILNDYQDIGADQVHPVKKFRPLAAGLVSLPLALITMFALVAGGLLLAWSLNPYFLLILTIYFAMNVGYSYGLKHIALLDIFIIALGFLFRVLAGGFLANVVITQWLVIMVFLLALFLALAKRRDDIVIYLTSGQQMRQSVKQYNLDFLNSCLTMLSAIIMVSYIMYSLSEQVVIRHQTEHLYVTAVFVIAGMMRYLQITMVEKNSGSPTDVLYKDTFIRLTVICWIISFFLILYLPKLF